MECDHRSKTDWIYIRETIEEFYRLTSEIKIRPVFMAGKKNYLRKHSEVKKLLKSFECNSKNSKSAVLYCFDLDGYLYDAQDRRFIEKVRLFCEENSYDFVWFCKDIEEVYLGTQIDSNYKAKESVKFGMKHKISSINVKNLECEIFKNKSSNILLILDKYLDRKDINENR